ATATVAPTATPGPTVSPEAADVPMYRGRASRPGTAPGPGPEQPEFRWCVPVQDGVTSSPAVAGDRVYVGGLNGQFHAFEFETGEVVWSVETEECVVSSPAVVDGRVYVGGVEGTFWALDADTGEVVWQTDLGPITASPAVTHGR